MQSLSSQPVDHEEPGKQMVLGDQVRKHVKNITFSPTFAAFFIFCFESIVRILRLFVGMFVSKDN